MKDEGVLKHIGNDHSSEELNQQIDNLKKQVKTLAQQNDNLEDKEIKNLKQQFDNLLQKMESLKKYSQQIATLKQEKESLIKQTQDMIWLRSQIDQLKNLLEDKENSLKEKVDDLQYRYKQIQNFDDIYQMLQNDNQLLIAKTMSQNKLMEELREEIKGLKNNNEQLKNNNEELREKQSNNQHNIITIVSLLLMGAALHYLCNRIFNGLSNTNLIKAPDTSLVTSISKKAEFILNNTKDLSLKI